MPVSVKAFDISSNTVWVAQKVLSTPGILSAIIVKRLAVEREVKQKFLR